MRKTNKTDWLDKNVRLDTVVQLKDGRTLTLDEVCEAYASSRLAEVSVQLEALQRAWASLTTEGHTKVKRWNGNWHEYPELTSMNVLQVVRTIAADNRTLRAEVECLKRKQAAQVGLL